MSSPTEVELVEGEDIQTSQPARGRMNQQDVEARKSVGKFTSEGGFSSIDADIIVTYIKYIFSTCFCMMYVVYLLWGIFIGKAVLPGPPVVHFFIFIFCLTLLGYLEGLQVAILAVEHIDPATRRESHPRAYKLMTLAKTGNNVERFLVGRQFFTIFVVTLMAQVTSFPEISSLGVNSVLWFIFIQTGLPGAMVVTTVGSLQPQLLAAKDPWKFMDLYCSYSVLNLCLGAEFTGICTHFAWLLIGLSLRTVFITENKPQERAQELTFNEQILDFLKYIVSTSIISTFLVYLMWGIWTGEAILPLPPVVVFIVFVFAMTLLAHLEGLQVALLTTEARNPEEFRTTYPNAYSLHKRATYEKNVRRFLIGRQFFVIFVVFLINQCTIFPDISKLGINPVVWFIFVQLGFPAALNILSFGQLLTQLLANVDPLLFNNRPGPRATLELCLFAEGTGIAHFSWVVTSFSKATWFKIDKNARADSGKYVEASQQA